MFNQVGQLNLCVCLVEVGIIVSCDDLVLLCIFDLVKMCEDVGYVYDGVQVSFELLVLIELGWMQYFFDVECYCVIIE